MSEPFDKLKKSLHEVLEVANDKIDKRMKAAFEFVDKLRAEELAVNDDLEMVRDERLALEDQCRELEGEIARVKQLRSELEAKQQGGLFAACMARPKPVEDVVVEPEPDVHLLPEDA
mmetsp:Transcript_17849/g.38243  ORF Transcript_17849/g.38243 Transcript_17849/m.38243 type:complete len:117 (+) Transcript_17849:181-531(+)